MTGYPEVSMISCERTEWDMGQDRLEKNSSNYVTPMWYAAK